MSTNCLGHLRATLDLLEPQVVVIQGAAVCSAITSLVGQVEEMGGNLELAELAGRLVAMASFAHPSYPGPKFNWSWPSTPYFQAVVLPTLRRARRLALDIGT